LRTGLPSDVDFQAQVFSRWPVYLVDRPGAVYLGHPAQFSAGYDVSHVSSWAKVFKRLDHTVDRHDVFARDEYPRLRRIMAERFSNWWRAPGTVQLPLLRRVTAAYAAGVTLGDTDTAMSILGVQRLRRLRPVRSLPRRVARRGAASLSRARRRRR
jgi:hypothetical protein